VLPKNYLNAGGHVAKKTIPEDGPTGAPTKITTYSKNSSPSMKAWLDASSAPEVLTSRQWNKKSPPVKEECAGFIVFEESREAPF
jgi:hypothetical protein